MRLTQLCWPSGRRDRSHRSAGLEVLVAEVVRRRWMRDDAAVGSWREEQVGMERRLGGMEPLLGGKDHGIGEAC